MEKAVSGEVYLAEIDYQWAEKAASGLKDERLTPPPPPYIGRLVRSLAAVLDWGMRKGYSEVLENASQEPRSICGRFCEVQLGSGAVVNNLLYLSCG